MSEYGGDVDFRLMGIGQKGKQKLNCEGKSNGMKNPSNCCIQDSANRHCTRQKRSCSGIFSVLIILARQSAHEEMNTYSPALIVGTCLMITFASVPIRSTGEIADITLSTDSQHHKDL